MIDYIPALSSWTLVFIAAERFLGVVYPLRIHRWATKPKFGIYLGIVLTLLVAMFIPISLLLKYSLFICSTLVNPNEIDVAEISDILSIFVISLIPSLLIVTFNMFIIGHLIHSRWLRSNMRASNDDDCTAWITINLIMISAAFVVLNLPANIDKLISNLTFLENPFRVKITVFYGSMLKRQSLKLLVYTNHGINFWLYAMTGGEFRHKIAKLFCRKYRTEQSTST